MTGLLLGVGAALALGESADIELLRPTFSAGSIPGIDAPPDGEFGRWRLGVLAQYTRDPLVLYAEGQDQGAVIARRQTLYAGFSADLGRRTAARVLLPLAAQWGSENPNLAGSGLGMGDLSLGLRQTFGEIDASNGRIGLTFGGRADLMLPTGTRLSWLGEDSPRGWVGGMAQARFGYLEGLVEAGALLRSPVDTELDFLLGSEAHLGVGGRYLLWPDRFAFTASLLTRSGFSSFLQAGAETSAEALVGLQISPTRRVQWDVGVGKGLAQGYGTSEFRLLTGVTLVRAPTPPAPPPPREVIVTEIPVPITPEELAEPAWEEGQLAKIVEEQIVIRDPIQFEFNTANILPESIPTLRYVAGLLNENWKIGHIVIEGHASDEGTFEYNYALSIERARSIFEELVRAGVHPDRVSYRGMGEVVPSRPGENEAALAANRRVEFHIIRQYAEGDPGPDYRGVGQLPWSGEPASLQEPVPPRPSPPDPLDVPEGQFEEEDEEP